VDFSNISFSYPTRPDAEVLKGFNMTCKRGQVIAMVGASGAGKSTALQLLERFYESSSGTVVCTSVLRLH
jgi:ABC-type multidrug transport system fused ATPase/permease subunit